MNNLMKRINMLLALIGTMLLFTVVAQASIYTVTNSLDNGQGSLRQAIIDANNHAGKDFIFFNISGGGVHTITLLSELPFLSGVVEIDGYTQPGSQANTLSFGDNAVLQIELSGGIAGPNSEGIGLFIPASGSTIRGLVINQFHNGIFGAGGTAAITVEGCFIGTDPTGTIASPNRFAGILLDGTFASRIGGELPAQRNLISGNGECVNNSCTGAGVMFIGTSSQTNSLVEGNFIGTDHTSQLALGNTNGIFIAGTLLVTVGGVTAGDKNVISGNRVGIHITSSNSNQILGNYIGTNAPGVNPVGNTGVGVLVDGSSSKNSIGDATPEARNVISSNGAAGISIVATGGLNAIKGNFIGTDFTHFFPLGNGGNGVDVQGSNSIIGGTQSGAGNLIVYNKGAGVFVSNATGNSILGNVIYGNTGLGIDLAPTGVTPNDLNDVDPGPNDLQNFPVISNATYSAVNGTQIGYSLSSKANTTYTVELFVSDTCNPSGYGEGKELLSTSNLPTDASGVAFAGIGSAISYLNKYITATASDPNGSTSEFSKCVQVTPEQFGSLSFSAASYSVNENGGTATITVQRASGSSSAISVQYATIAGGTATIGSDYAATSGTLNWAHGDNFDKTFTVAIVDDNAAEQNKTILLALSNPTGGATLGNQSTATLAIADNDSAAAPTVQFNAATYTVQEDLTAATITVTRGGDTSGTTTVEYATADGTATQQGDYELTSGTLTFAPGDTTQTFQVLINEDSYVEGTQTINLALSKVTGASLGAQSTAVLNINDDAVESPTNPNDEAQNFVYQQYHDLLNREPDSGGLAYWTAQIAQCGNDQNCLNSKRKDISAAFYIELEFQETGYFVYRMQKASFGTQPTYAQFMADRSRVDANKLKPSKQAFTAAWVQRAAFKAAYPDAQPADQFVNKLYDSAGLIGYQAERLQATQDLMTNTKTRAQVLRDVIETPEFITREYNPSFVLMQYFAYLRRDADPGGYQFWLNVINNQVANDTSGYHAMVCGFVTSAEYQDRFSPLHTHGNGECGQ